MAAVKFSEGALAVKFGGLSARDIDLVQAGWQLALTDRRERIATAVLQALVTRQGWGERGEVAELALLYADDLLNALEPPGKDHER